MAEERELQAREIVKKASTWAGAAGFLPIPLLDQVAIGGIQVKMLIDLANHYKLPFSENRVKSILSALLGCVLPYTLADSVIGQSLKMVPIFGPVLGILTVPGFSSAITWAVGKVFIQHFEAGGTFLDFQPDAVKEYFRSEFTAAKPGGDKKAA